jgi:hypothetical protein
MDISLLHNIIDALQPLTDLILWEYWLEIALDKLI